MGAGALPSARLARLFTGAALSDHVLVCPARGGQIWDT